MVGFYRPPPKPPLGLREVHPTDAIRALPVDPPPPNIEPVDPDPWIEAVLPPVYEIMPPPPGRPVVVIEPVEVPPTIVPPPPDITPETIVPPVFEDPIPAPLPDPTTGGQPPTAPPPTIIVISAAVGIGTFMVYVGKRLVLTMAASVGTSLGKAAGAMLVGAVSKQLFRGASIRFHSGKSPGNYSIDVPHVTGAVSYEDAWRMVPQEFSYWEK